jgi:hypothetical protein
MSITEVIATGVPKPGQRLEQRAERERDDHGLDALIGADRRERPAQHREVAGLHGHVVDPDRVHDDPHDREEAEDGALRPGVERLADGHLVHGDGDDQRDRKRDQRGPLRFHLHAAEQDEQSDERQRREDR